MQLNEDECYDYTGLIQPSIDLLIQNYNKFKRIDYKDDPSMEEISDLNILSYEINLTIEDIESKIKMAQEMISQCSRNHDELKKQISSKEQSTQRLKTKFIKEREEVLSFLSNYQPKEPNINYGGYNENLNTNDLSQYDMNELMLEEEKLKKVKECIYEQEKGLKLSPEEKQQILLIKNQIKELMGLVKNQIDEASVNLVKVDEKVDEAYINVQKGNEELRRAALIENQTKKVKYRAYLTSVLAIAGTIVPGIGNAIGAIVGYGIATGIAKLEEQAIKKIGKKK